MKRFIIKKKQNDGFLAKRPSKIIVKQEKNIKTNAEIVENVKFKENKQEAMDLVVNQDIKMNENIVLEEKNNEKEVNDMDTKEKIMAASAILAQDMKNTTKVKRVRNDKGLIEKTESSKIILTEDNRELLND